MRPRGKLATLGEIDVNMSLEYVFFFYVFTMTAIACAKKRKSAICANQQVHVATECATRDVSSA